MPHYMGEGGENMQKANDLRDRLILEFTDRYMEKLFYFYLKKTGSHIEAEELTQDAAFQIITALYKGTIPTSFSAWVWQIARNRYAAWAREKHARNALVTCSDIGDYDIEDESEDILDEMMHTEQMALLRRELAFIKGEYRNIIVAYYIESKNVREIASSLSLSTNTVKSRLLRARQILKEGMDMARKFGKLSYSPENISFINNGLCGANGEPWNYISRSLCKNILLAAYRTPSTAEELAMEIGVALPYMEDELCALTEATLLKKNDNKYETAFFIVSAAAQEKINAHLREITPALTKAVIAAMEYEVCRKNEHCPAWHEGYQPLEDMKWTLLMEQTDRINFDTLNAFHATRGALPTAHLGKWGHTVRPNEGEWDLLGMESYHGDAPAFVGLHGCVTSPAERALTEIDFRQFRFQYQGISDKVPASMPYSHAQALVSIAKGETAGIDESVVAYLERYGYIRKEGARYAPTFLVMFHDKNKTMPQKERDALAELQGDAVRLAMRHYLFCREQLEKEIPAFLKEDAYQMEHACANVFNLRGAVLEEALRQGYITYSEHDERNMLGVSLRI